MFPKINMKETGDNIRRIMKQRGITSKEIQEYLELGSIQSVYNWCNGINMPTIDNLYALSQLLQVAIDDILCGNKKGMLLELDRTSENSQLRRVLVYRQKMHEVLIA